jgi:hypothetical protein
MNLKIGFWIIPCIVTALFWIKWHIRENRRSYGSTGNLCDSLYEFILAIVGTLSVWLIYFATMYLLILWR